MTTRKTITKPQKSAAELLDNDPQDDMPLGEEFTPEDIAVSQLLAELGDEGVIVRIYRQGPKGYKDLTYIDECGVADFSPKMLKAPPFNGGTFRIHAQAPGAGGMRINRELKVEPAPFKEAPTQTASNGISAAELGAILAQNNRDLMTGLATALQPKDSLAGMKEVIGILAPILGARSAPVADDGIQKTLSLLATAKTLFDKPDAPPIPAH